MKSVPIVEHFKPAAEKPEIVAVDRLAAALMRERPNLALEDDFRDLVPRHLDDAPSLHLDDLTMIPHLDAGQDVRFYQQRARMRAGDGDLVATSAPKVEGYEQYCREYLELGSVEWLYPTPPKNPLWIAEACWEDERVRRVLIERVRRGELGYIHPHMGTCSVWELAALLRDAAKHPISVIAPPPRLTSLVNDKIAFAEIVVRLFGRTFIPRTSAAWNFAMLAARVKSIAQDSSAIGIKLPCAAGGDGTLVINREAVEGLSLRALRAKLEDLLASLNWDGECGLLVDRWESDIICSPSVQMWIPPEAEGPPVVEAIFVQEIEGQSGVFVGSVPAQLPTSVNENLATRCWLLARLFKRLGYVGRCSFDMILTGESPETGKLEFVECNGRWGGTSAPMTLVNRLFGDWSLHPFAYRVCDVPGIDRLGFCDVLRKFESELFDCRTRTGRFVLTLPGRIKARSALDVIALGSTVDEALTSIEDVFRKPVSNSVGD